MVVLFVRLQDSVKVVADRRRRESELASPAVAASEAPPSSLEVRVETKVLRRSQRSCPSFGLRKVEEL